MGLIDDSLVRIAQRRKGRTRLVYDRRARSIVAVPTEEFSERQRRVLGLPLQDAFYPCRGKP